MNLKSPARAFGMGARPLFRDSAPALSRSLDHQTGRPSVPFPEKCGEKKRGATRWKADALRSRELSIGTGADVQLILFAAKFVRTKKYQLENTKYMRQKKAFPLNAFI